MLAFVEHLIQQLGLRQALGTVGGDQEQVGAGRACQRLEPLQRGLEQRFEGLACIVLDIKQEAGRRRAGIVEGDWRRIGCGEREAGCLQRAGIPGEVAVSLAPVAVQFGQRRIGEPGAEGLVQIGG